MHVFIMADRLANMCIYAPVRGTVNQLVYCNHDKHSYLPSFSLQIESIVYSWQQGRSLKNWVNCPLPEQA